MNSKDAYKITCDVKQSTREAHWQLTIDAIERAARCGEYVATVLVPVEFGFDFNQKLVYELGYSVRYNREYNRAVLIICWGGMDFKGAS